MYIGAKRIGTSSVFQWIDGSEMTYVDWASPTRLASPYNCIQVTVTGWVETRCESQAQSMACEATVAPLGAVADSQLAVNNITMNEVNNTIIPFVSESVDSVPDDIAAYGFTVQLSPTQCITGDRWVMGREMIGAQYQSSEGSCIYAMRAVQDVAWQGYYGSTISYAVPIGDLKPYITTMQFRSSNRFRGHLSFSYIFWTTKGMEWMTTDAETGHVYGLKTQTQSWDAARGYCTGLGADWALPSVTSTTELFAYEAITKFLYPGFTTLPVPLGIHQPTTGTDPLVHVSGEPIVITNWDTGYPLGGAVRQCVVAHPSASWRWRTQACTASTSHVICETAFYTSAGTVSMVMNPSMFGYNYSMTPFTAAILPTTELDQMVFGATALITWQQCEHFDRFLANVTHDKLVVMSESQCQLHVVGQAILQQYKTYLGGLKYLMVNGTRDYGLFGYVIWNTRYQRSLLPNLQTGKIYTWVGAAVAVNTPTAYWPLTTTGLCTLHSMHPMELYSAEEEQHTRRAQQSTFAHIGAIRTSGTGAFTWMNTSNDVVYENWYKHAPQATGTTLTNGCALKLYGGSWNNINCNQIYPAMCEGAGDDVWNYRNRSAPIPHFEIEPVRNVTRILVFNPADERARNFSLPPGMEHFPNNAYAHGLSIQVSNYMCVYGDLLEYTVPSAELKTPNGTDVSVEYVAPMCTLFIRGLKRVQFYKAVFGNFSYYSNNRQLMGITFGWVLWWDARVANLFMDPTERHVYTYVDLRNKLATWYEAQEICHQYGKEWSMASIDRDYEANLFAPLMKSPGLPMAVQRNMSGYFENVNRKTVNYFNWDVTYPTSVAAASCVEYANVAAPNRKAYRNVDCASPRYTRVLCETDQTHYVSSGQWAYVSHIDSVSRNRSWYPVRDSHLPPDSSDHAFGATIQTGANECRPYDQFQPRASHDHILLTWELNCVMSFNGEATITDYKWILTNILFNVADPSRDRIRFGVIINMDRRFEMLSMDLDNGDTYTAYVMTMPYSANPTYPIKYSADSVCAERGMLVATLKTEWQERAANGAARFLDTAIGLKRVGTDWRWNLDNSIQYPKFLAADQDVSPKDCVVKLQNTDLWLPVHCTNRRFRSLLCQAKNTTLNIYSNAWIGAAPYDAQVIQYPSVVRQIAYTTANQARATTETRVEYGSCGPVIRLHADVGIRSHGADRGRYQSVRLGARSRRCRRQRVPIPRRDARLLVLLSLHLRSLVTDDVS
jgi:hypothetical protein